MVIAINVVQQHIPAEIRYLNLEQKRQIPTLAAPTAINPPEGQRKETTTGDLGNLFKVHSLLVAEAKEGASETDAQKRADQHRQNVEKILGESDPSKREAASEQAERDRLQREAEKLQKEQK